MHFSPQSLTHPPLIPTLGSIFSSLSQYSSLEYSLTKTKSKCQRDLISILKNRGLGNKGLCFHVPESGGFFCGRRKVSWGRRVRVSVEKEVLDLTNIVVSFNSFATIAEGLGGWPCLCWTRAFGRSCGLHSQGRFYHCGPVTLNNDHWGLSKKLFPYMDHF